MTTHLPLSDLLAAGGPTQLTWWELPPPPGFSATAYAPDPQYQESKFLRGHSSTPRDDSLPELGQGFGRISLGPPIVREIQRHQPA